MNLIDDLIRADAAYNLFSRLNAGAFGDVAAQQGALAGWTIGLKDNIAVAGFAPTAGMAHRAQDMAAADAHAVRALRAAGATLIPGLNMDEAALGGLTDNPHFGRTDNPRAPGHSAGGSSGGSAAPVASGVVRAALGTDTLGSVRIPASYCGIYGLRPTSGLLGRSGIVPLAPSLDAVGPMAACAADLWPVFRALAGTDPADPASVTPPDGWDADDALPLRIGVPRLDLSSCEPAVRAGLSQMMQVLRDRGIAVNEVDVPGWSPAALRRAAFLLTECEGAVALAADLETGQLSSWSPNC